MAASNQTSTLPQGFSVFQPSLGAALQFLPAIGTRELDELINVYVAGPASTQEKRASVSLDFLEYTHITGQTFKFYPVYSMIAPMESPATASPLQDSGYGSSFNASPAMSNWDWSQVSDISTPSGRSPSASQKGRLSPKATVSRQTTTDFSHLPGMKILTKDGMDVTNSASRGSKTKEQRDHAHLMRIIKACDSCRRKKIRCDPSHKKRGVPAPLAQPAAKVTKKTKPVAQKAHTAKAPSIQDGINASLTSFISSTEWDTLLASAPSAASASEPWDEFIDYAPAEDYDFFNDPEGYLSPLSSSSSLSQSACSTKPVTPIAQQDVAKPYETGTLHQTDVLNDYVDFNLFSPSSTFSEDDRMVSIELSRQPTCLSQLPPPPLVSPPTATAELSSEIDGHGSMYYGNVDGILSAHDLHIVDSEIGGTYRDPDLTMDVDVFTSPGSSEFMTSGTTRISQQTMVLDAVSPSHSSDAQSSLESNVNTNHNVVAPKEDLIYSDNAFTKEDEFTRRAESDVTLSQTSALSQVGIGRTSTNNSRTTHLSDDQQSVVALQSPSGPDEGMSRHLVTTQSSSASAPLSSPALSSVLDEGDNVVFTDANKRPHESSSCPDAHVNSLAEMHSRVTRYVTMAGAESEVVRHEVLDASSSSPQRAAQSADTSVTAGTQDQNLQTRPTARLEEETHHATHVLCTISALVSCSRSRSVDAGTMLLAMLVATVAIFSLDIWSSGVKSLSTSGDKDHTRTKGKSFLSRGWHSLTSCWHGLKRFESQSSNITRSVNGLVSRSGRFVTLV